MTSSPLITVITITLNDRKGFSRTAESLLSQELLDEVEWVVVDGGSTDGTLEAISEATADDRAPVRTKVLDGPDGGIVDAMIRGAAAATGEYLQFLNSGDQYHADSILRLVSRELRPRAGASPAWLYGQCRVVDERGRSVRPLHARRYSLMRHAYHVTRINHQAVFVRRDVFRELGGFRPEAGTALDFDLLMRLGLRTLPRVLDTVLIDYLEGGVSQTRFRSQMALAGRARRTNFALSGVRGLLDRIFTAVFVVYGQTKLALKPLLVRLLGRRFLDWWSSRRVIGHQRQ